jgi:hypothetical protein
LLSAPGLANVSFSNDDGLGREGEKVFLEVLLEDIGRLLKQLQYIGIAGNKASLNVLFWTPYKNFHSSPVLLAAHNPTRCKVR